jgi:hypothetical protein
MSDVLPKHGSVKLEKTFSKNRNAALVPDFVRIK